VGIPESGAWQRHQGDAVVGVLEFVEWSDYQRDRRGNAFRATRPPVHAVELDGGGLKTSSRFPTGLGVFFFNCRRQNAIIWFLSTRGTGRGLRTDAVGLFFRNGSLQRPRKLHTIDLARLLRRVDFRWHVGPPRASGLRLAVGEILQPFQNSSSPDYCGGCV